MTLTTTYSSTPRKGALLPLSRILRFPTLFAGEVIFIYKSARMDITEIAQIGVCISGPIRAW